MHRYITDNGVGEKFKSCHDVRVLPEGMELPDQPDAPDIPEYCIGARCELPDQCRSQWSNCGAGPDYCNDASFWRPECDDFVEDPETPEEPEEPEVPEEQVFAVVEIDVPCQ